MGGKEVNRGLSDQHTQIHAYWEDGSNVDGDLGYDTNIPSRPTCVSCNCPESGSPVPKAQREGRHLQLRLSRSSHSSGGRSTRLEPIQDHRVTHTQTDTKWTQERATEKDLDLLVLLENLNAKAWAPNKCSLQKKGQRWFNPLPQHFVSALVLQIIPYKS